MQQHFFNNWKCMAQLIKISFMAFMFIINMFVDGEVPMKSDSGNFSH